MTKWKCEKPITKCSYPCYVELANDSLIPRNCIFCNSRTPQWERVPDESEQKQEENTLPDWCKVGEWVYVPEIKKYFKITDIQGETLMDEYGDHLPYQDCVQARLRPWTFEEAPIVLKVKDPHGSALAYLSPFGGKYIVAYHRPDKYEGLKLGETTFTFSAFADIFTQIDGSPCGVLEHLENGEWKA